MTATTGRMPLGGKCPRRGHLHSMGGPAPEGGGEAEAHGGGGGGHPAPPSRADWKAGTMPADNRQDATSTARAKRVPPHSRRTDRRTSRAGRMPHRSHTDGGIPLAGRVG